ncbi:MAG: hypothetical protein ACRBBN_21635 [Methyloligellaceae bacterium]
MIDLYTKSVLTVIAVSLAAIAIRGQVFPDAVASNRVCGEYSNPCYITVKSGELEVKLDR